MLGAILYSKDHVYSYNKYSKFQVNAITSTYFWKLRKFITQEMQ